MIVWCFTPYRRYLTKTRLTKQYTMSGMQILTERKTKHWSTSIHYSVNDPLASLVSDCSLPRLVRIIFVLFHGSQCVIHDPVVRLICAYCQHYILHGCSFLKRQRWGTFRVSVCDSDRVCVFVSDQVGRGYICPLVGTPERGSLSGGWPRPPGC